MSTEYKRTESKGAQSRGTRSKGTESRARLVLAHATIYLAALIFALPVVYAFFTAMKPNNQVFAVPPSLVGSEVRWRNFVDVFTYGPFARYILNSFFIAVASTVVTIVVSSLAGYAFSRMRWRGREAVFLVFLATLMVPSEVVVIPMFTLMQVFGWVNTYQALVLPFAFSAFGTFLMRQFLRGIPYELEEAAKLDGAGAMRTFLQVIMPLAKPAVAVLAVFSFLSSWNSYLWPLIVTVDYSTLGTLPVGLASFSGLQGTRWDLQMAATIISMVPTTILVIVLQKHLVKGLAMAGLGGR